MSEPYARITERERVIELPEPIIVKSQTVTEIRLKPPTFGAKRKAETHLAGGATPQVAARYQGSLFTACSGLSEEVLEQLDTDIFNEVWSFIQDFLDSGPKKESETP